MTIDTSKQVIWKTILVQVSSAHNVNGLHSEEGNMLCQAALYLHNVETFNEQKGKQTIPRKVCATGELVWVLSEHSTPLTTESFCPGKLNFSSLNLLSLHPAHLLENNHC